MKTSSRRTVQIPIVQPGGAGSAGAANEDRLIEVYTQLHTFDALTKQEEVETQAADAKARDKDWDRVAAPLRKAGLYQAGCAAASAVRKLGIKQPLTALYQRISRLAWIEGQRLHRDNYEDKMSRLAPGESVELLLSRHGTVFSLAVKLDPARPQRYEIRFSEEAGSESIERLQTWLGQELNTDSLD